MNSANAIANQMRTDQTMKLYRQVAAAGLSCVYACIALPAAAQQVPDAGQTLQQQQQQAPQMPRRGPTIDIQPATPTTVAPGGATVVVRSVTFSGNTVFSQDALQTVLGDFAGQSYHLAGLRGLADRVSAHYRDAGYPFARAFLPAQSGADGALQIEVVEGRYGDVRVRGDVSSIGQADAFLASLKPGEVIESVRLERATLLLDDLPGISVSPIIRPGRELGTGDLDVNVRRERSLRGDVGFDNHGNRYIGEYRARLNVDVDSPFMLGDQIQMRSLLTDEGMWLGSLAYSLPLGGSGLRGQAGYSHTAYELGKQFSSLDATGTASVATLGVTYPVVRSQRTNVTVGLSWQHKTLRDEQDLADTRENKSSQSVPLTVQFDRRDTLLGGGVTFGSATWTSGRLHLDSSLRQTDRISARTHGTFSKLNLDLARLQALPMGLVAYGRVSAQWADGNLDSSEGFGVGGSNGVRAYPTGEGYGDEGWLAQLELRYTMGTFAPYAFYDEGRVRFNTDPWDDSRNHRAVSGAGVGVRIQHAAWSADAAVAWRVRGGEAQSDTLQRDPMGWITVSYQF